MINSLSRVSLIATDLDGTLLAYDSVLPEANRQALETAMLAGVRIVLCSGRMPEAMLPLTARIRPNAPMVSFNGALVCDSTTGKILSGTAIPLASVRGLLRTIESSGVCAHIFPGSGFFYHPLTEWTPPYENKIGVRGTDPGIRLSDWVHENLYKILCLGPAHDLSDLHSLLEPLYPELTFVRSAKHHLEIMAGGVSKASGLAWIASSLGIPREEILAFGDERNDLPMLLFAGRGYAMENGPEDVKRAVRYVAPKNTEMGLARIINLFSTEGLLGRI